MTMKWMLLLSAVVALAACDDHEACDPGQQYRAGICYQDMDAAPEAAADAGGEAAAEFGDPCVETSECGGPTDYCAIRPGEPVGYCTRVGCIEEPSICPQDWDCLDLSVFSPELPAICSAP